ncbi:MAG TPA: hypothetical protein VIX83_10555 [Candidatus Cybelea sp.]
MKGEPAIFARTLALAGAVLITLSACNGGSSLPAALSWSAAGAWSDAGCRVAPASPPHAPAYAATTWPSERADQWRTAAADTGLAAIRGPLHVASAKLPPVPVWGYVGVDGDLYVLGGAPYFLDVFTKLILGAPTSSLRRLAVESRRYANRLTPYVARIDPSTMRVTTLQLTQTSSSNYIGGMLVDANGYLYAVARGVLYKIDPKPFSIVASKRLPLPPNDLGKPNDRVAFNGMQATLDGDLLLKGFAPLGHGKGILLRIDPDDLSILATAESSQIAGARMALTLQEDREYVYLAGATESIRYLTEAREFKLDGGYSQQYLYPSSGDTEGTSDIFMGRGIVFTNNTSPEATSPMSLFAQGDFEGAQLRSQPAFSGSGAGWNFFMATGDPFKTGILAVQNQANGHIAGFVACNGGITAKKLWENDTIENSAGLAIDYADGQLYADDHRCASKHSCRLSFVVLDLRTGKEIARTRVAGNEPSVGQIFIGPHRRVFYLATDTDRPNGFISRVSAP